MGHRVIEKLGDLEVVEKITFVQKMASVDQTVPPECGDFFDHLQITSILAHMIYCTNKARFPTFYIFLNFFEFILPSRLTDQNISLYLRGALQNILSIFLKFFEFIMPSRLTDENIGLCLMGAL